MSPTRRQFLLGGTSGITALAGCSTLSDPKQFFLLSVNNYTESRQQGHPRIENDGVELVHQYLEVAVAAPDTWATVETNISLGEMPDGTRLAVTASFGDGLTANGSITLDYDDEYNDDAIFVQIENEEPVTVRLNEACYDEFPLEEASQGGLDHSRELDRHPVSRTAIGILL